LLNAIGYILAGNNIKVQVEKFNKEEERAKEGGNPWILKQKNKYYADLIKKATTACNTIATKFALLLNPEYGDFIKVWGALQEDCTKEASE
jgi:poly-D-alanine transfer protein DltD